MIKRAFIQPLRGKYYGTIICITDINNKIHEIKLWDSSSGIPSIRELNIYHITEEQWLENGMIKDYEVEQGIFETLPAREICEISDSHFESKETYGLALEIVKKLNS